MKKIKPPKWADCFLSWYCRPELLEDIQGDVYELFYRNLKTNKIIANWNFIWNVFRFFRLKNIRRKKISADMNMYQNYFTVFKRNFIKQKGFSFLNIIGLATGITCVLLISLYIKDELSYDKFHDKSDRIYRVHEIIEKNGIGEYSASIPFPTAEALMNDYGSQILKSVRFFNFQLPTVSVTTSDNSKEFNESRVFFVDSTIFDVFDFKIILGNQNNALDNPNTVVITQSTARKYFGNENPIGKYLKLQATAHLLITGVIEDIPLNSHIQFDFLISFSTVKEFYQGQFPTSWHWNPCWTYFLIKDNSDLNRLQASMPEFVQKYFPAFLKNDVKLKFFPLTDIHLKSKMDYEIHPNGNISIIYIFVSIAVFMLVIVSINFINLTTALAAKRAKEVGIRKALGSQRPQLILQFLFESISLCFLAVLIAVAIISLILPLFNSLAEKNISLSVLVDRSVLGMLCLLPLILGLISGIYPAFILSSFKPLTVLKGSFDQAKGTLVRKILVVFQFGLSIILIVCTGVAISQLNMLKSNDTGFANENIVMIPVARTSIGTNYETLRNSFLSDANVREVTAVEDIIGARHQTTNYLLEGMEESRPFPRITVRHDFLKTFDIQLAVGRDYSRDFNTDDSLALLVNEQLVKAMNWESNEAAIGKTFGGRANRKIIGVVKDFNFASKHQSIKPLIIDLSLNPAAFNWSIKYMVVRITGNNITSSIESLHTKWKELLPDWPFEYFFLKDNLEDLYKNENKLSKITFIFSGLSIVVACLGLFGLSTFTAEQRKKEMSIRKVMGSSNGEIFMLFSNYFFILILISNVLAFPLAYLLIKQWLSAFAYRVNIDFKLFLLAGVATITIAFITICYQAFNTARTNPAKVLKNE